MHPFLMLFILILIGPSLCVNQSPDAYNVEGGLTSIGAPLLLSAIRSMPSLDDVLTFLSLNSQTADLRYDTAFEFYILPTVAIDFCKTLFLDNPSVCDLAFVLFIILHWKSDFGNSIS